MKLIFPIVFGLIVFCSFVLPQYVAAQGYVARLVAIAVTR
jgi:hypothetical protein